MREEVLRLDRVTYIDRGVMALNHFTLSVFAGEIMGLIPITSTGLRQLLALLRDNPPIHYGYVYYRERLVNHWGHAGGGGARVSVIGGTSSLVGDLSVAENVFVLRPGYRRRMVARRLLRGQLGRLLEEIGIRIPADAYARDLSGFERLVVEIVKAVIAGSRLIVLLDAGTLVGHSALDRLHDILRHYAADGIAFLYTSQHYEETRQVCDRVALMIGGQIAKVLRAEETPPERLYLPAVRDYETLVRAQGQRPQLSSCAPPALAIRGLCLDAMDGLDLTIAPGSCVVVQDLDNRILDSLLDIFTLRQRPRAGEVLVGGAPFGPRRGRDVAVVQRLAPQTMLFPDLSYLDNLCFTLDHRLPMLWARGRLRRNIREEYAPWLGNAVFDKSIDALTPMEQYDLIYARVLLQRPKVAICVQPFMQADVAQRMHIWKLLEKLLSRGIAVVILAVNLADTLSLADRLVLVKDGRVQYTIDRADFGTLSASAPWRHLWREDGTERT